MSYVTILFPRVSLKIPWVGVDVGEAVQKAGWTTLKNELGFVRKKTDLVGGGWLHRRRSCYVYDRLDHEKRIIYIYIKCAVSFSAEPISQMTKY